VKNIRGYFGIGVFQPKTKTNIGTLWRSAYQLGASFIFVIGKKYKKQTSDTCKTYKHIPLFEFKTYKEFKDTLYDCIPVIVEFDVNSKPLRNFVHPKRCVYILGAEDNGLSKEILNDVKTKIEIESIRQPSFNVAMAGTIIMYDRLIKDINKRN